MKFKRLEIQNIASVRHAVIDFDKEPLAGAQLFLINGPTGSGKSIILDAICLALFRTAPRLENLGNRKVEDGDSDESEMKLSSPLSLVRRGAPDAFVSLCFEGNNGHIYVARWETQVFERGAKKGRIKGESQSVSDETDGVEFRGATEIRDLIKSQDVLGLDFGRFTRTTMLAQGSFTRFLASDEKEKTDILQKIVGLDMFSRIGRKISEIFSEKKRSLETEKAAVGAIVFMNDETLESTRRQLAETSSSLDDKRKQYEEKKNRIAYIDRITRLREEVTERRAAWMAALEDIVSDRYIDLVTIEDYIARLSPLIDLKDKLKLASDTKSALVADENVLVQPQAAIEKGLALLSESIRTDKVRRDELQADLKLLEPFDGVIVNSQSIKKKIKQYNSLTEKIAAARIRLSALREKVRDVSGPVKTIEADIQVREKSLAEALEHEKTLSQSFDKEEFEQLTSQVAGIGERLKLLNRALAPSQKIDGISERITRLTIEQSDNETTLTQNEETLRTAGEVSEAADKQLAAFTERYDRARRSVSDAATELRHGLKKGDQCPVCGSDITKDLLDETFQKAFHPFEEQLAEFTLAARQAMTKINEAKTVVNARRQVLANLKKSIEKETRDLVRAQNELTGILADSGYSVDEPNLTKLIESEIESLDSQLVTTNTKVKELSVVQNQIIAATGQVTLLTAKLSETKDKLARLVSDRDRLEQSVGVESDAIDSLLAESTTVKNEITGALPDQWKDTAIDKLSNEIDKVCDRFKLLNNQVEKVAETIKSNKSLQDDIAQALSTVRKLALIDDKIIPITTSRLRGETNAFLADRAAHEARKTDNDADIVRLNTLIADFYTSNSDLTATFCDRFVLSVNERFKSSLHATIATIRDTVRDARQAFVAADNIYKSHIDRKLELSMTDDYDTLVAQASQLDSEIKVVAETVGALRQRIADDADNKKRHAARLLVIDALETEVAMWSEVNSEFGGQNGDRFSRIACAYVLNHLIERANYYLPMFTSRYRLASNSGSLEIRLHDNISGYTRAFNTLSGGESFMVSLSLALALSAIQDARMIPDTIFIDEGFGTLSADCLDSVTDTLEQLHLIEGRRVGIISHIESLRERIPVKITVTPAGQHSDIHVSRD